jgi:hypothetical protein
LGAVKAIGRGDRITSARNLRLGFARLRTGRLVEKTNHQSARRDAGDAEQRDQDHQTAAQGLHCKIPGT